VKRLITRGIVLSRTEYGEADRIVTMLTPDQGKLRLMVRGARRLKSKLAGGIELFSVSDITFMPGRGDMGTLISARLSRHYANIVKDIDRVQLGYELIKQLDRATEDSPESDYFDLLGQAFAALDDSAVPPELIRVWFQAGLLKLAGHEPNLLTDAAGQKLAADRRYNFDYDAMAFMAQSRGGFAADHIKFLRLLFSGHQPQTLTQVQNLKTLLPACQRLVQTSFQLHINPR